MVGSHILKRGNRFLHNDKHTTSYEKIDIIDIVTTFFIFLQIYLFK